MRGFPHKTRAEARELGGPLEDSRRVVWRLVSLETIDMLGQAITDGRGVDGELFDAPSPTTVRSNLGLS